MVATKTLFGEFSIAGISNMPECNCSHTIVGRQEEGAAKMTIDGVVFRDDSHLCVHDSDTLETVLKKLSESRGLPTIVVDQDSKVVGVLSDGDVRRLVLKGVKLSDSIRPYLKTFRSLSVGTDEREVSKLMRLTNFTVVPVLDETGTYSGYWTLESDGRDLVRPPVVILAGGKGTRLRPTTAILPKPLIEVAGQKLIEYAIQSCEAHGFSSFFVSVNYKKEMVLAFLADRIGDGTVTPIVEETPLGTAGPLSLLPSLNGDVLVANADVLHSLDLSSMLRHHVDSGADITVATEVYEQKIPFGVLDIRDGRAVGISEKPSYFFPVSGGIYLLSESARSLVPAKQMYDMPDLIQDAINRGLLVVPFAAYERIMDVGTPESLRSAREILVTKKRFEN